MSTDSSLATLAPLLRQYWGFDTLRPLQAEAIDAGVRGHDSLVVMPTGGGKSLCYQIPPLVADRTDVVVSPLIALMKDQVDGLQAIGYPAAAIHSNMSVEERREVAADVHNGRLRLLLVSPEKLLSDAFIRFLRGADIRAFAIDEAHCISHWGHDFRPSYRRLSDLRTLFPDASIHAFTATATQRVRADIVRQLGLREPSVLVGDFDRPNLIYRVIPRTDMVRQVVAALKPRAGQAAIVYCISRKDTEYLAAELRAAKFRAAAYHAGMDPAARRRTQDDFARERIDVVTATVAFGMGIDRSDVRCVVHAAMPKSIEHYQQESGRAGRDGLDADCVLLYSAADAIKWEGLITKSAEESEIDVEPRAIESMVAHVREMQGYACALNCRHAALVGYFGQAWKGGSCGACDVCLGEVEGLEDCTELARKILSCVARTEQRFGAGYIVDVLKGANTERILSLRHHQLSTYALLREMDKKTIQRRVYDLVDQGLLTRDGGDLPILRLNEASWEVMRGHRKVMLRRIAERVRKRAATEAESWEGVDQGLFESLRGLRREIAEERAVPAYVVFTDVTLREIARMRPTRPEALRRIQGVGKRKIADYGRAFATRVREYCGAHGLETDVGDAPAGPAGATRPGGAARTATARSTAGAKSASSSDYDDADGDADAGAAPRRRTRSAAAARAFAMFERGATVEQVMAATQRAASTTQGYLEEFIAAQRPASIDAWVDAATQERVRAIIMRSGTRRLKPMFDELGGIVPYEVIRIVAAHVEAEATPREDGA
jgi:ATP-dependent DNA helicase RecQ